MARWADYSAGRPSGAALKQAGFTGALRYIALGREGKQLSAAEYRDLVATFGASNVLLVAEAGTADAWGTDTDDDYARGLAYGKAAVADARATGVPDSVGLACAADAHAQAGQIDDAVRFARGFRDAVGQARAGVYGFIETLTTVHEAGIGSWFWLAGSELAPNDPRRAWVNVWQRNSAPTTVTVAGVPCDINEVYRIPNTEEDDMPTLDEIYTKVWYNALWTVKDANGKVTGTPNPSQVLAMLNDKLDGLTRTEATQSAQIAGLVTTVTQLAQSQGATNLTEDKLRAMLNDAVAQNVRITGTVAITGAEQSPVAAQ